MAQLGRGVEGVNLTRIPREERGLKKLSFLIAGLFLALFQAATALSDPNWTVYYNIKYGVTDQETADLYLLNKGVMKVPHGSELGALWPLAPNLGAF
jgi:hypothetical protein